MTNLTPQPASEPEEWRIAAGEATTEEDKSLVAQLTSGGDVLKWYMPASLVDAILTDHAQAARAWELEEALKLCRDVLLMDRESIPAIQKAVVKADVALASHRTAQEEAQ